MDGIDGPPRWTASANATFTSATSTRTWGRSWLRGGNTLDLEQEYPGQPARHSSTAAASSAMRSVLG